MIFVCWFFVVVLYEVSVLFGNFTPSEEVKRRVPPLLDLFDAGFFVWLLVLGVVVFLSVVIMLWWEFMLR